MVQSMTGFGRAYQTRNACEIVVEIKSLNHRYFDFSAQLPNHYDFLQLNIKRLVQSKVKRGKLSMSVSIHGQDYEKSSVQLNKPLLQEYLNVLKSASDELLVADDLSLSSILKLPDIFIVQAEPIDQNTAWEQVKPAVEQALDCLVASRAKEGAALEKNLLSILDQMEALIYQIQAQIPLIERAYQEKLYHKLQKILDQTSIDDSRILTEAAIFSDKIDTNEEIVRLQSHILEFRSLLTQDAPIGKHCDFLAQECNREANTIASKANDLEVNKKVILLKTCIEQIREQIQNIE